MGHSARAGVPGFPVAQGAGVFLSKDPAHLERSRQGLGDGLSEKRG